MTDQHRATEHSKNNVAMMPSEGTTQGMLADCIQEIFSRIEALEAAQLEQAESHRFCTDAIVRRVEALEAREQAWKKKVNRLAGVAKDISAMTELRAASAEARPAGGLVERVEEAIITGMVDGDRHAARAAIREVAVWLRENKYVVPTMDQRLFESEATTTADIAAESASIIVALIEQEADRG
jgi:hypothetical protein